MIIEFARSLFWTLSSLVVDMIQALLGMSPRDQILKLRRERFQIDELGKLLGPPNPLAGAADGMGEIVATHMYSTVGRFMCEYLQNVGDNTYAYGYVTLVVFCL